MINFSITGWDILLLIAVTLMATAIAYLHPPKWKALVLSLPIPFTIASLSLGIQVNVTHALGLLVLLLYTYGVRFLHVNLGRPIIPSIILCAAGYAVAGTILAKAVPATETAFWAVLAGVFALSAILYVATSPRVESGHRTPLPVWVKVPIIAGVVFFLIISKKMLQGFMTTFPMVGVIAAYEARHSLWTMCRQVPFFILSMAPMVGLVHIVQPDIGGLGPALSLGWFVYLALLLPATRSQWAALERRARQDAQASSKRTVAPRSERHGS